MNENAASITSKIKFLFITLTPVAVSVLGFSLFFARNFFFIEILNNFRLQLAITLILCGCVFYSTGYRKIAMLQLLAGLVAFVPIAVGFLPAKQPDAGPREISLMSFNILGDNTDRQPVLDVLANNISDVLVVVELEGDWIEALEPPLSDAYSFSVEEPRWHGFGIAVHSRYPILDSQVHALTKTETDIPLIAATINVRGQIFNLFACHFLAPITTTKMDMRNRQMDQAASIIQNRVSQNGHPAILVGDFNCVPWSPFANDLMKKAGLRDSRKGYFYQGSWPVDNSLVSIPIDNAFVSNEIHIHDRKILPGATSDHFPLLLEFSVSDVKSAED